MGKCRGKREPLFFLLGVCFSELNLKKKRGGDKGKDRIETWKRLKKKGREKRKIKGRDLRIFILLYTTFLGCLEIQIF